jgi:hypothetical protein
MPEQSGTSTPAQHVHEDSFFVLRDCRELFQKRLAEIARLSGISSPKVIEALTREVGAVHDELASSAQQDGFGQTAGLTASRITLVGNDELDLEIRIADIANRLKSNDRIESWRVQLRYMSLLQRPKMAAEDNPLGLEPICSGLWAICRESGNNLDQNLDLLGRLEEDLQARLPDVYTELNGLLESHRVEPAPTQVVHQGRGSGGGGSGGGGSGGGGSGGGGSGGAGGLPGSNALATLQQAMRQQFAAEDIFPAGFLTSNANPAGSAGNIVLNASTLVMLNHLMERLHVLELHQVSGLSSNTPVESGGQPALRALRSKDLDVPLGKPAAIALDTLSLIFESIFAASDLPDAVKAAIGRLQIPLLKLAILDPSFFADTQHPARRLVNRMARAAIGLAQDTGREHPVCVSLGKVADAVRSTLESNDGELSPHLEELDALIEERDKSLQANAQPYVQLVLEHEAREASRSVAQDWLIEAISHTTEPAIRRFLSEYWLRVMQSAHLDGGTGGTRWTEYDATSKDLVWSVQPRPSAEERKQLLSLIPSLIKRINAGLDLLAIPAEERTPFLNACFDLQTAALRTRSGTPGVPAQPPSASAPEQIAPAALSSNSAMAEPSDQIIERNGIRVHYLGRPAETPSPWRSGVSTRTEGDWISFYLPDEELLCGRHCGQASSSGTVLLFNSDWGYAVAMAPSLLEQQVRDGRARIVSESALFDEAAERALVQIAPR